MIKKMIKGEKGFTLVELLAVIVILGIIVAIAIPAIGTVIENAQKDADEAAVEMILDAARLYDIQSEEEAPYSIDVEDDLIGDGYLNPRQAKSENLTGTVEVADDGTLTYEGPLKPTE